MRQVSALHARGLYCTHALALKCSIIKVVSALISPLFTEKVGRRRLCLVGGAIMVPCMFSISGVLRVPNLQSNAGAGIALITIW